MQKKHDFLRFLSCTRFLEHWSEVNNLIQKARCHSKSPMHNIVGLYGISNDTKMILVSFEIPYATFY